MGGFTELMTHVKLSADLLNTTKAQSLPVLHQTESREKGASKLFSSLSTAGVVNLEFTGPRVVCRKPRLRRA